MRVRGAYRGPNRHRDLPEATRKGGNDWVLKDGYFAAWVTGKDPRGEGWDLTRAASADADATVEIAGVPATVGGVVRISAREVSLYLGPEGGVALAAPRTAGAEATPPRVAFAYPVPGETLDPRRPMIIQFSKPLDPRSLESRVRVRYGTGGAPVADVAHDYRERARALVVSPQPPPPPGTEIVVELMEGIIDIDGRALVGSGDAGGVVERGPLPERIVTSRALAAATLALAALGAASRGAGQEARPLTFGTDVGLVRLDVTVERSDGRFVTDLKESDFELLEDGRPQEISTFTREELPVSMVLLVDSSISVADRMPIAQGASARFVGGLRPDDEVRVTSFNEGVTVLQDFTSDKEALRSAIDRITAGGATALYNALYATLRGRAPQWAEGRLRRRVIVLLSDGEDTASLVWEEQVVELVRRREATVHVIALRKESDASNRSARILRLLSAESGGDVHRPDSIRDLDSVYSRIADELRSQYMVGYVSSNPSQDGSWRKIELRVKGKRDLQVRHRVGYYALP